MKLRHLNIFIVVCEEMNMTKAAERLYMSQPSVSQVVMELESHYESKLFERLSRKIYLTDAGRELLTYAYHIRGLNEELEEKSKLLANRIIDICGGSKREIEIRYYKE